VEEQDATEQMTYAQLVTVQRLQAPAGIRTRLLREVLISHREFQAAGSSEAGVTACHPVIPAV